MSTGLYALSAGASASVTPTGEKKPFIIAEWPDYCKEGYSTLKLGICQVLTEEWEVDGNIKRTLAAVDQAATQGAEIAVTPECVFHGYASDKSKGKSREFRDRLYSIAESPSGRNLQLFRDKAAEKRIYIQVGFVEKGEGDRIHNSAALIGPDGSYVYIYRKVHCRHFESINHYGYFTPGDEFYTARLNLKDKTFIAGTMICFDREVPESLRCLRSLGAEIVFCPLATGTSLMTEYRNKADNEMITRTGAACNEQFIAVVNHARRFNGGSFIVGPMGELFCQMTDEPGVLTCEIPLGVIARRFHAEPLGWMGWGYRRPEIYSRFLLKDGE